jgi:Delta7-sterol 5-desaturase
MPNTAIELLSTIARDFFKAYAMGIAMNGTLITLSFVLFWKIFAKRLQNWKVQLGSVVKSNQIKREMKNAIFSMASGAFLSCIILYLVSLDVTRVYTDISEHSILFALAGFPVLIFFNDMWFYWMHRLLHHPRIYGFVHAEHHRSITVNPLTSFSFHWLEPILLTIWVILAALIFPIYAPVLGLVQIYGIYDNIKSHLGYELYPSWLNKSPFRNLSTSTYHDLHHRKYNGNYGLHFRFWDKWMGTELPQYEKDFEAITVRRRS